VSSRLFAALGALVILSSFACPALAHDAYIAASFSGYGIGASQTFEHDDIEPFKGWMDLTVTNTTEDEWWTDFHLMITSVAGSDVSMTDFIDYAPYQPTSSQALDSWVIDNSVTGATMDICYYNDPVGPGETAWFKVYTDNTAKKVRFGLCVYPTVPEPSSIFALSGLLGVAGMAWKRRK